MDKKARCIELGFSLEALLGEYVEAIRRMAIERGTAHETLEDLAREVQRFCARSSCLLECLEEDIRAQMPGQEYPICPQSVRLGCGQKADKKGGDHGK